MFPRNGTHLESELVGNVVGVLRTHNSCKKLAKKGNS